MAWNMIAGGIAKGAGENMQVASAYYGTKQKNRKLAGVADSFQPYSGIKPPEFKNLQPVSDQITNILMKRSQGEDVGYDPRRLALMKQNYDIDYNKELSRGKADRMNQISGMGLSRNLAARDALMNRYLSDMSGQRTQALNQYDIADMEAARQDKNMYSQNLQNWGQFGYGQENQRASFDADIWRQEQDNERARRMLQLGYVDRYNDPVAVGLAMQGANVKSSGNSLMNMNLGSTNK